MQEEILFKKWILTHQLKFSFHAVESLKKRNITIGDVYYALKNKDMKFIQVHPPFTYRMQGKDLNKDLVFVILGHNNKNFKFHMVIAKNEKGYTLITVYKPCRTIFADDHQTLNQ